jgi:hypothetical protein
MFNFLAALLFLILICLAGWYVFLGIMGGAIVIAGGAWAALAASICAISLGILFIFLFAGFWIFLIGLLLGIWVLIALILFPIFLPVLLPLLLILFFILYSKKKKDNR